MKYPSLSVYVLIPLLCAFSPDLFFVFFFVFCICVVFAVLSVVLITDITAVVLTHIDTNIDKNDNKNGFQSKAEHPYLWFACCFDLDQ